MKNHPQPASVEVSRKSSDKMDSVPNAHFNQKRSTLQTMSNGYISSEIRLANPGVDAFFFEANRPLFASARNNEAISFMAKKVIEGIPTEDAIRLLFAGENDSFRDAFSGILDGETGVLTRALFSVQDEYLQKVDDLLLSTSDKVDRVSFNRLLLSKALMTLTTLSSFRVDSEGVEHLISLNKMKSADVEQQVDALATVLSSDKLRVALSDRLKELMPIIEAYAVDLKRGSSTSVNMTDLRSKLEALIKTIVLNGDDYADLASILTDTDKTLRADICALIALQTLLAMRSSIVVKGSDFTLATATESLIYALITVLPTASSSTTENGGTSSVSTGIDEMLKDLNSKVKSLSVEELAKGYIGVHRAIKSANDQREALLSFLHDRTNVLSKSFDTIEEVAKAFVHSVILISQAASVEEARAILQSFKRGTLFRNSGANQLINAASVSRSIDSDSLKRVLATLTDGSMVAAFNSFLPDSLTGLDVASSNDLPSIPGVPTRRLAFKADKVASITVSSVSRIEKVNDLDLMNLSGIFQGSSSLDKITPLVFYILRMNSMIGSSDIDSAILGQRTTSFLIHGIQLPSIIKDSLLAEIRSISVALALELNIKRESYKDWGKYALLSISDLTKYLSFFVNQNSLSFTIDGSGSQRQQRLTVIKEALDEKISESGLSDLISSGIGQGLPLFEIQSSDSGKQINDPQREMEIIRSFLDDKKHSQQIADYVKKVFKFALSDELASTRSVTSISHVLELDNAVFGATSSSIARTHDFTSYDGGQSHEALTTILEQGTASSLQPKLIPGFYGPAVQYMISLNPDVIGISGMLDFSGTLKNRWQVTGAQTNPDELTRRALGIMFENIFSYRLVSEYSKTMNLSFLYRKKGGIFLSMLRFASSAFEGAGYGFVPEQVGIAPAASSMEVLEKVLNSIGLSKYDTVSRKEAVDLDLLLSRGNDDNTLPVVVKDDFLTYFKEENISDSSDDFISSKRLEVFGSAETTKVTLGDILSLSTYGKTFVSSKIMSFRGVIYLRSSDFIEMMCSDMVQVTESGIMKTFWINRANEIFFRENEERIEIVSRAELNLEDRESMSDAHAKNLLIAMFNNFRQVFSGVIEYGLNPNDNEISPKRTESLKSPLRQQITEAEVVSSVESAMLSNANFFKERMAAAKAKLNSKLSSSNEIEPSASEEVIDEE